MMMKILILNLLKIIKNNKDILDKINKIMLDVDSKRIESKKVGLIFSKYS